MNLQVKLAFTGNLRDYSNQVNAAAARGARNAVEIMAARAKLALRDDVRKGGLGEKVANTWRANTYPPGGKASLSPAAFVYSKAPLIITAFSADTTIVAKNARWLAIPTENTPNQGRRRATPQQVESIYDQDLILIPGRGGQMLAFIDKTLKGKLKRARAKGKSLDIKARFDKLVLMFVMVRQVHLRKRLDYLKVASDLSGTWRELMATEIAKALDNV